MRRISFGRRRYTMVDWMHCVSNLYRYYTHTKPNWDDPHWYTSFKAGRDPSQAVHDLIDGPEFEVDEEAEVTVDWDKEEAEEAVCLN